MKNLFSVGEAARLTRTTVRTRNLERRLVPAGAGSSGLPNAVMIKTDTQTIGSLTTAQINLDSSTLGTTDPDIFSASGSDIVIAAPGFYVALATEENDSTDADPTQTQFGFKWLKSASGVGANAPNEQIVPKTFNANGLSGLQGFLPQGDGTTERLSNISWAYCSDTPSKLRLFYANLLGSSIQLSTAHVVVFQVRAIDAATLTGSFPSYPF